ncbi:MULTISPECIES: hypothetical protein [unclassified Leifsonia]|uniref:hypothetical protein n=1 Tax=unclassified Leifsonia TaxID=2663824 RepID=UPI0006F9A0A2|nr:MULTISPECIES: hypothetical protein [unclassified Leifsonia]KQX06599.1 hypothetical protein ASC59_01695 [Leifsonia sp. Root1293]KRA10883.1 hypothetical protein ASD61_01695 [Leifsonia sp. Root60]
MKDYAFAGAESINRAIGILVALDQVQVNAMDELAIDSAIDECEQEYEKAVADPSYVPSKDFIVRLDNYLALGDRR